MVGGPPVEGHSSRSLITPHEHNDVSSHHQLRSELRDYWECGGEGGWRTGDEPERACTMIWRNVNKETNVLWPFWTPCRTIGCWLSEADHQRMAIGGWPSESGHRMLTIGCRPSVDDHWRLAIRGWLLEDDHRRLAIGGEPSEAGHSRPYEVCQWWDTCFLVFLCKLKLRLGVPVCSVKMNGPAKMCVVLFILEGKISCFTCHCRTILLTFFGAEVPHQLGHRDFLKPFFGKKKFFLGHIIN